MLTHRREWAAAALIPALLGGCSPGAVRKRENERFLNYYTVLADTTEVKRRLKNGADPNVFRGNTTPLRLASWVGDNDMVDLLLRYSADVNKADTLGVTPLMVAIIANRPYTVKLLISKGASVDVRLKQGPTLREIAQLQDDPDLLTELGGKVTGPQPKRGSDENRRLALLYSEGVRVIYYRFLQKRENLEGRMNARFAVQPDGTVADAVLTGSTTGYEEFDRAVLDEIRHWQFHESPGAENDILTLPFSFGD